MLMFKAAFIWSEIQYNSNTVKYNYNLRSFIPLMAKLYFQLPLLQSSVSHGPSEIILICCFGA